MNENYFFQEEHVSNTVLLKILDTRCNLVACGLHNYGEKARLLISPLYDNCVENILKAVSNKYPNFSWETK